MSKVHFKADTHQYFVGGFEYLSVTQFIEHFVQPFNAPFWSAYKALEKIFTLRGQENDFEELKRIRSIHSPGWLEWVQSWGQIPTTLFENVQSEILADWDRDNLESRIRGNIHHEKKEQQIYTEKGFFNRFTKEFSPLGPRMDRGDRKPIPLEDLPSGCYPELRLYHAGVRLAGTSDFVDIKRTKTKKYAWIDDHKTNKEIEKQNVYQKMKFPLSNLDDCNYNHYRLQLGTYGWMLEEAGYTIKGLGLQHFDHDEKMTHYNIIYSRIRPYVVRMMDYRMGRELKRARSYGFGEHQIYS